jgi:diguanylate cyclase (GGDEF)-like protein
MNDSRGKTEMKEIVALCLSINLKAAQIYEELALHSETNELKDFWASMADEEKERSMVWRKLEEFAGSEALPDIFGEPGSVVTELEGIERNVSDLLVRFKGTPDISESFILAFRLEMYLLHQALDTLYNLMSAIAEDEELTDTYEERIGRFVDMLEKYGEVTPEIELLGETLHRLWRDNRKTAMYGTLDDLTGLYSRRGFRNASIPLCHLAQRNEFNVCIMVADIDNFKEINDEHGHLKGDQVLVEVAQMIRTNIRTCDVIARYGGDEFIILFSRADKETITLLAEKVRSLVEKSTRDKIPVTVSIGIADGTLDRDVTGSMRKIQERAVDNLVAAQRQGRNQVVIDGG